MIHSFTDTSGSLHGSKKKKRKKAEGESNGLEFYWGQEHAGTRTVLVLPPFRNCSEGKEAGHLCILPIWVMWWGRCSARRHSEHKSFSLQRLVLRCYSTSSTELQALSGQGFTSLWAPRADHAPGHVTEGHGHPHAYFLLTVSPLHTKKPNCLSHSFILQLGSKP